MIAWYCFAAEYIVMAWLMMFKPFYA